MIPNFTPLPFFQANVETWFPARSGKRSGSPRGGSAAASTRQPYDLAPNCNRSVLSKLRAPPSRTLQHVLISRLNSASRSIPPDAAPFSILSDSDRLSKEFPPRLGQSTERARVVARLVRFFPFRLVLGETRFDRDEEKRAMVISFDIGETLLRGKYVPFFSYATIMHDTRDLSRYSAVVISVYSNF